MNRLFGLLGTFCAGVLLALSASAAPLINGRFESGSLSGWTIFPSGPDAYGGGYAATVDSSSGYLPLQGDYSALLMATSWTGCSSLSVWPELVNCPYPNSGSASAAGGPALANEPFYTTYPKRLDFLGAVIAQDIDAKAGDVLSWEWQRFGEPVDSVFMSITNGTTSLLYSLQGAPNGVNPGWWYWDLNFLYSTDGITSSQTPLSDFLAPGAYRQDSLAIPSDGTWTIAFGIAQNVDGLVPSAFLLDNVRLRRAVPEPGTWALLSVGLAGLVVTRRRRQ